MKELYELLKEITPKDAKIIPTWILLSGLSIGTIFVSTQFLNDFKSPLFYLVIMMIFAFWAQIIYFCSIYDVNRARKKFIIAKVDHLHKQEQEIFREFLTEKSQIITIQVPDPYIDRLCEEGLLSLIGTQPQQSYIFQLSQIAQQLIRIRHLFKDNDIQRLSLSQEQQEWLLFDAIGRLTFQENALNYLQARRHFSKRPIPPQPKPVGTCTTL